MKKYIFVTALILSMTQVFAQDSVAASGNLEDYFESFYEAPASPLPDIEVEQEKHKTKGTPVFKKIRIKATNYLRERDYKKTQKLLEEQRKLDNLDNEVNVNYVEQTEVKPDDNTLELEGGVKEHVTSNDVMLDADNVDYDDLTMDIIATGSPVLVFPPQNVSIKADKMVYNKASNILKAYGKVEIIRDGNSTFSDYLQINMNEENAILDNIKTNAAFMTVTSRKSEVDGDKIVLYDGKMLSENSYILNLQTRMIGGNHFNSMIIDDDDKSSISNDIGETAVNIKADEIIVNAKRDHDTITLKKAQIRYGDVGLFKLRSFTAHTNKKHEFFEANYPELGSRARIGMFAGPGFVFDTPLQDGSTLKVIPMVTSKDGFGIGGFLKYRSATNHTDFGYSSGPDVFILKGRQYLDDKLYFQYGSNSYLDNWWLGPRMAKYDAELIYKDESVVPSTIGEGLDLRFRHRFGVGYMHNSDYNRSGEHIVSSNMGTLRTRYMAEIDQSIFKYEDKEKLRKIDLGILMQGSAALYGTGDTQFIGRIGPRIRSQYKYWMQDLMFYTSAYQDGTPMQMYDCYRYGHANLYLREALRVNKYLTVAWSGSATMTGDAPNGEIFQENTFIIALGPDDFKVNMGYDFIRKQTYFSFVIAMDTKGSSVEFNKMIIKNPDKLSKNSSDEPELKVFDEENLADKKIGQKRMMYAEVIDIEDPDREQI